MKTFSLIDEGRTYKSKFTVASGVVGSIGQGVPTFTGSGGNVAVGTDGQGTTSDRFTGMCVTPSTDTASAAGVVFTFEPLPGIVYKGSPKVAGSFNTSAKIDALKYKRVVFDLTATVWTIDSAASDASTNTIVICGGDYQSDIGYFFVMDKGTYLGA